MEHQPVLSRGAMLLFRHRIQFDISLRFASVTEDLDLSSPLMINLPHAICPKRISRDLAVFKKENLLS